MHKVKVVLCAKQNTCCMHFFFIFKLKRNFYCRETTNCSILRNNAYDWRLLTVELISTSGYKIFTNCYILVVPIKYEPYRVMFSQQPIITNIIYCTRSYAGQYHKLNLSGENTNQKAFERLVQNSCFVAVCTEYTHPAESYFQSVVW